jgi:hypothetical protein
MVNKNPSSYFNSLFQFSGQTATLQSQDDTMTDLSKSTGFSEKLIYNLINATGCGNSNIRTPALMPHFPTLSLMESRNGRKTFLGISAVA